MKPAIHLAFSDDGEHIRFWTASEGHAREWARENWETEPFFSGAQMAAAQAEIDRLRDELQLARDTARSLDLPVRLRAFEGSDELGNGDFAVCQEAANEIERLRIALVKIVNAYDAYRGCGVVPAPREYADLVASIAFARVACGPNAALNRTDKA